MDVTALSMTAATTKSRRTPSAVRVHSGRGFVWPGAPLKFGWGSNEAIGEEGCRRIAPPQKVLESFAVLTAGSSLESFAVLTAGSS
jgi:hypothetical protein